MSESAIAFVAGMVRAVPELETLRAAHLEANDEILPHVFLGAVTQHVIEVASSDPRSGQVERLLEYFEQSLELADEEVRNLIGVSFLENLHGEPDAQATLEPLMGPGLRREARSMWTSRL